MFGKKQKQINQLTNQVKELDRKLAIAAITIVKQKAKMNHLYDVIMKGNEVVDNLRRLVRNRRFQAAMEYVEQLDEWIEEPEQNESSNSEGGTDKK